MNSNKITNLATPTADTDAATKGYVDALGPGTVSLYCGGNWYDVGTFAYNLIHGVQTTNGYRWELNADGQVYKNGVLYAVDAITYNYPTVGGYFVGYSTATRDLYCTRCSASRVVVGSKIKTASATICTGFGTGCTCATTGGCGGSCYWESISCGYRCTQIRW